MNDNAPIFSKPKYLVEIAEDTPIGTSFLQIAASDADASGNAIVDYFLDPENDFFRLDRTSGTLRVSLGSSYA